MRILVTGGSGTIGSYLLRDFRQHGYDLTCYSRTQPIEDHAEWVQGDIGDIEGMKAACRGHDAIIHLAAVPGPGRATPEQLLSVNVIGTVNVLEAAVAAGVGKLVFASSNAASGFSFQRTETIPEYLPVDEAHPAAPQDEYGLSKLLAELTCRRYSDAHGIQTICLRINHNWYIDREGAGLAVKTGWAKGLSVEELWDRRYRKVLEEPEGEWPRPGPPVPRHVLWAVTDVRDAIQAFRLAIENPRIRHDVLNINGSDTCSTIETPVLIQRHFPDVPLRERLQGYTSLVSHARATELLGYQPQYSWRDSDFRRWLDDRGRAE